MCKADGGLMKNLLLFSLLITLVACAAQKSIFNIIGLERISIEQSSYDKPDFFVGEFEQKKAKRSIASVATEPSAVKLLTNRQLYFLSFYRQYKTMGSILKVKEELNSCPRFHDLILRHKSVESIDPQKYTTSIELEKVKGNSKLLSLYPVMAMPYSRSQDVHSAVVANNWKNTSFYINKGLHHYYKTVSAEMQQLCDRGSSDGYYVFENLVTYFKGQKSFHGTKFGLKALLKVPVLANMVILDNLERGEYNYSNKSSYDQWLLRRTNASWFGDFVIGLKKNRELFVSSNYINRIK